MELHKSNFSFHPLNQILYGPPGTGKTYATRKMAVEICDGIAPTNREELKKRYKELVDEKRIGFSTFHQSMSYEDFVEGIKPDLSQADGSLNYKIENGIFKRICVRSQTDDGRGFLKAFEAFTASIPEGERFTLKRRDGRPFEVEVNTRGNLRGYPTVGGEKPSIHLNRFRIDEQLVGEDFYDSWNVYVDGVLDHLENHFGYNGTKNQIPTNSDSTPVNKPINEGQINSESENETDFDLGWNNIINKIKSYGPIDISSNPVFYVTASGDNSLEVLQNANSQSGAKYTKDRIKKVFLGETDQSSGGRYSNAIASAVKRFAKSAKWKFSETENKKEIATPASSAAARNDVKPHVLIIDEINRGNTPAIFGELITLIEEDKRLGNPEELTVTLPYSKEPFGVPNNLYIIGTMNTADRSVEALDAALRRRFEFKEVGPDPSVLTEYGVSDGGYIDLDDGTSLYLPDFLQRLNHRIIALRDRDHTIGHANFMKVDSGAALGRVLAKAIIPLLQEYFYGDDAQLARILGMGFVEEITDSVTFARTDDDEPDLPKRFRVKDPSVEGFDLANALRLGGFETA